MSAQRAAEAGVEGGTWALLLDLQGLGRCRWGLRPFLPAAPLPRL